MKNYILNIGKGMIFAGAISLASCTGWFDNVPPYEATEDILEGDNVKVGAFFPQLQRNVGCPPNTQFQVRSKKYIPRLSAPISKLRKA